MNRSRQVETNGNAKEQQDFSDMRAAQIECILRTVTETVGKIKLSLALPGILQRAQELPTVLRNTPYEQVVIPMVEKFVARRDYLIHNNAAPLMDSHVVRMIDSFQENYQMHELFPQAAGNKINCDDRKLLRAFDILYEIADHHFHKSAKTTLNKERELHRFYSKNEALKSNISEMQKLSKKLKIKTLWRDAGKRVLLQKYESDLQSKKYANSWRTQTEIIKCKRNVRISQKKSWERRKELEEELERLQLQYKLTASQHFEKEQEARAEKNKLLLQLQNSIKKYDQTFSEKVRESLTLQDKYEETKRKIDDFMVIFHQEEAIYAEVVLKPEEAERLNRKRQAILFMMNRAARKIQRYWRAWRKVQLKKSTPGSVGAFKKKPKQKKMK